MAAWSGIYRKVTLGEGHLGTTGACERADRKWLTYMDSAERLAMGTGFLHRSVTNASGQRLRQLVPLGARVVGGSCACALSALKKCGDNVLKGCGG